MAKEFENARLNLAMLYLRLKGESYETEAALLDAFYDTLEKLKAAENVKYPKPEGKRQRIGI